MAGTEHPINSMMDVTLEKIRQMVDSNTIIGNPITTQDGTTILPVSKVTFGFTSGGSDFVSSKAPKDLFGGGSGAGVSMVPVAFLVLKDGNVRMLQLADKSGTADRALNMLPEVLDKLGGLVAGKGKKDDEKSGQSKPAPTTPKNQADEEVVVEVVEPLA